MADTKISALGAAGVYDGTEFIPVVQGGTNKKGLPFGFLLRESQAASDSATLDFTATIASAFDVYLIQFLNLIPVTNNVDLWMRCSTDGGSSYDSGNNYFCGTFGFAHSGSGVNGQAGSAKVGQLALRNAGEIANTALYGVCGELRLWRPSSSDYKRMSWQISHSNGTTASTILGSGSYVSTSAVNAFRFLFSSGNISSGTIRTYGLTK